MEALVNTKEAQEVSRDLFRCSAAFALPEQCVEIVGLA